MKRTHFPHTLSLLLIILMIVSGCYNNQQQQQDQRIPVNADNVKNHIIDIKLAREYTKSFRDERSRLDSLTQRKYLSTEFDLANAESLNRDVFALLLEQKDKEGNPAAGIRMYNGRKYNETLKRYEVTLVLVPYDKNGNDIINKLTAQTTAIRLPGVSSAQAQGDGGNAIDNAPRCPEVCDNGNSGLNGPTGP